MSEQTTSPPVGTVGWIDLTVPNATAVRDFYQAVVGWDTSDVDMGGYNDYCMLPPVSGEPAAGVCHARGHNVGLPTQWLIYITVADLDLSMAACTELGGSVIARPKSMGSQGRFCVIRDPSGAVAALYEAARVEV
jgi:predicted enzyme related to lactoylglutathione lyase